ncbi:ATP-binding protein [Brasilonema sp. UFV-L1]|uniref:ATP-binding protein n=1 Tax=Brasilonema sp. UFV-L1 TaxID=2234130 RepID=UPI00145DA7E2|nr:ATP-binding protein [Brasilonema sp. UFV-L1]NMG08937.1 hypothetical protein [Brasilonema sp. UFV-L1]
MGKQQQRFMVSWHRYQEQVEETLATLGNKPHNILVFYGRAGIGKTDLSKLLFQYFKSHYLVCARLDGEGIFNYSLARKPIEPALQQLRADLARSRVDLSCFDLAYLMYRTGTSPLIATISPEAAKGKDWLENINNGLDLTEAVLATKLLETVSASS